MTLAEMYAALLEVGYPVAYRAFKEPVAPPFICYLFTKDADFIADGANYFRLSDYQIELYTREKDPAAEAALEAQLQVTGLVWSKSEVYLDTEGLYEILYTVRA